MFKIRNNTLFVIECKKSLSSCYATLDIFAISIKRDNFKPFHKKEVVKKGEEKVAKGKVEGRHEIDRQKPKIQKIEGKRQRNRNTGEERERGKDKKEIQRRKRNRRVGEEGEGDGKVKKG